MPSPKEFKWAVQRTAPSAASRAKHGTRSGRVQKRAAASKKPVSDMERLENDLSFAYDTMATLAVHFESVHNAYKASQADMEKTSCATRLGDMEKELLAAYSDVSLQTSHFERKIAKLEQRLAQLRTAIPTPTPAPISVPPLTVTPSPPPLHNHCPPQYQSPTTTISSAPWSYLQDDAILAFPDTPSSFVTEADSFPFPTMPVAPPPTDAICAFSSEPFAWTAEPFIGYTSYEPAQMAMSTYPLYGLL